MKPLLCALVLGALGSCGIAASNLGQTQCLPAEKWATQPLACAASGAEAAGTARPASQWVAADAGCQSSCESRQTACLKEAKTDAIRDKCKVYLKGCLKSCSQGK